MQRPIGGPLLFGFCRAKIAFLSLRQREGRLCLKFLLSFVVLLLQGIQFRGLVLDLSCESSECGLVLVDQLLAQREGGFFLGQSIRDGLLCPGQRNGLLFELAFPVLVGGKHRPGQSHEQHAQHQLNDDQDFSDK